MDPSPLAPEDRPRAPPPDGASDIGPLLVGRGALSARDLARVRAAPAGTRARLSDRLRIRAGVSARALAEAEAALLGTALVDPLHDPGDPRLLARAGGAGPCLRHGLLPWRATGGATVVLSSRPEEFARHRDRLTALFGPVRMAVAAEDRLTAALLRIGRADLVARAERQVPRAESCRDWRTGRARWIAALACAALAAAALAAPLSLLFGLLCWAVASMIALTLLRLAAALAPTEPAAAPGGAVPAALPVVTLLVPLFREREIAARLLRRLDRIDYPAELLDIHIVLEEDDSLTRDALTRATLPASVRAVTVPRGALQTKPRALNYALNFARGTLIGVYDAEDRPAPDQIARVVARFATRGPEVACLQGVLDFYNSDANWITRCFALDYATWFRVVLPGLARLGFVVPLGGTTLFLRRHVLEEVGGWDAFNVTEDADLGLRLARHGYRTELIASVTDEEATGRLWPWIRQRSRWLKGYAITYAVHMRAPRRLWRDLGARRFLGVQALFLGTLSQTVLAPLLWSFWLIPLGFGHPLQALLPPAAFWTLGAGFFLCEGVSVGLAILGARRAGKARLWPWTLALQVYYPLATVAVFKGLWELILRPYYWDKTAHGIFAPTGEEPPIPPPEPPARPASAG